MLEILIVVAGAMVGLFIGQYVGYRDGYEAGREEELDKAAQRHVRMSRFSNMAPKP